MAADGAQAGAGEDGRVARALEIVSADAELGGLVQLLAAALQLRGMSVTDLEDGRCRGARARGHQQSGPRGWAGWIVDWASELYCWLQQPGVFDSVRCPPRRRLRIRSSAPLDALGATPGPTV